MGKGSSGGGATFKSGRMGNLAGKPVAAVDTRKVLMENDPAAASYPRYISIYLYIYIYIYIYIYMRGYIEIVT